MRSEASNDRDMLAAVDFRQRVLKLQISDFIECIAIGRREGRPMPRMDDKLQKLEAELQALGQIATAYAKKRCA